MMIYGFTIVSSSVLMIDDRLRVNKMIREEADWTLEPIKFLLSERFSSIIHSDGSSGETVTLESALLVLLL